jgi:exonuclease SbcC
MVNEEIIHGSRQTGLELDVFDSFSGQQRSVRSLSGGEKFLASISLSLGLADTIQARSGAIELDAIFIDEGFGSLDEEALDRALSILDEIRGNRMVGIISHVAELKNRIPSQIRVIKGSSGSRIES